MFEKRIENTIRLINNHHIDALALNAGTDLMYFTGLQFHLSERPVVLILSPGLTPILIYPEFETEKVKNAEMLFSTFPYSEDISSWGLAFSNATKKIILKNNTIGVNPTSMRYLELSFLEKSINANFVSATEIIKEMRIIKDIREIQSIRKAVKVAEVAFTKMVPEIKIGKTEKEIANELSINLLLAGSEPEFPFMPIIASGPNSSNPHAVPSDRKIEAGDLIVIDWGARAEGYVSDITRTLSVGEPDPEFNKIAKIVKKANETARLNNYSDFTSNNVDQLIRDIIKAEGYGEYFIHRSGHGIGLEPHEEPYIQENNNLPLEPGMVFTVEPGIYLPGKGGVRIEDNVLITGDGIETLTSLPRELRILKT